MQDLVKAFREIDETAPPHKQREQKCDIILRELGTLKGSDLAPYLKECAFDLIEPGTRIVLKFPIGAHVFVGDRTQEFKKEE